MAPLETGMTYQKYYDKYSPWLLTPSLRKQNKNLEVKSNVEIKQIEKVQRVWLKSYTSEQLKVKRDLEKINHRLSALEIKRGFAGTTRPKTTPFQARHTPQVCHQHHHSVCTRLTKDNATTKHSYHQNYNHMKKLIDISHEGKKKNNKQNSFRSRAVSCPSASIDGSESSDRQYQKNRLLYQRRSLSAKTIWIWTSDVRVELWCPGCYFHWFWFHWWTTLNLQI